MNINTRNEQITQTIIQKRKRKDTRNLWKKNNSRKQGLAMHVDQKNI